MTESERPTDRLARLVPSELDAEQASLHAAIIGGARATARQYFPLSDETGALHGPFGVMLHAPALGVPLQELGAAIRYETSLTDRAREIAILLVAVATRSDFEWFAHARVGLAAGLTSTELAALAAEEFAPTDPGEAAVVDLCAAVLDERAIGEEEYAELNLALGERALVELIVLIGYYRTLAAMLSGFTVSTPVDVRTLDLAPPWVIPEP